MGDYNPKTSYQFRWSDSKKIQKFIQGQIVISDVNLDVSATTDVKTYNFDTVPEAKMIAETVKYCYDNKVPLIIFDETNSEIWISTQLASDTECHVTRTINNEILTTFIDVYDNHIEINPYSEEMLSADNVKTLFGTQSIVGQGNIDLYRHQLILTNTNDVSVSYIIDSSNNLPIDSPQDFVTVTKADTDYTGHGLYLDTNNNIQPAFIRYSAGNVVIQLQNGSIAPLKSVKDKVKTI